MLCSKTSDLCSPSSASVFPAPLPAPARPNFAAPQTLRRAHALGRLPAIFRRRSTARRPGMLETHADHHLPLGRQVGPGPKNRSLVPAGWQCAWLEPTNVVGRGCWTAPLLLAQRGKVRCSGPRRRATNYLRPPHPLRPRAWAASGLHQRIWDYLYGITAGGRMSSWESDPRRPPSPARTGSGAAPKPARTTAFVAVSASRPSRLRLPPHLPSPGLQRPTARGTFCGKGDFSRENREKRRRTRPGPEWCGSLDRSQVAPAWTSGL